MILKKAQGLTVKQKYWELQLNGMVVIKKMKIRKIETY
jgi:hypothetical protein